MFEEAADGETRDLAQKDTTEYVEIDGQALSQVFEAADALRPSK